MNEELNEKRATRRMSWTPERTRWALIVVALLVFLSSLASAQQDYSKVVIKTTPLGSGLAMLQGAGGNLGVSFGLDGVLVIDDQFAPLTERIRAAISKLSSGPIRFVLNTHWHGDHTGGNAHFARVGAVIMAHRAVRQRMSADHFMPSRNTTIPASPAEALPVVVFDEGLTVHLNGQTIDVHHVDPAHTDGDSIVHFREADVLHLGDTFFSGIYPFIDLSSGGRIDGVIAAADRALRLAGPKTRIIPGHGPLSSPEDLRAYREMLVQIRDRVREMIRVGKSRAQIVAAKPTRSFDAKFGNGFIDPDTFTATVFGSLTADLEP